MCGVPARLALRAALARGAAAVPQGGPPRDRVGGGVRVGARARARVGLVLLLRVPADALDLQFGRRVRGAGGYVPLAETAAW